MRYGFLIIFLILISGCIQPTVEKKTQPTQFTEKDYTPLSSISSWQNNHTSNQPILQEGTVTKILKDDDEGNRHQKFLVKLGNGTTVLIAHNIDISTRIPDLENGATIVFKGEYEWNNKGGVVHWTHHDPGGRHLPGYLLYKGKQYD